MAAKKKGFQNAIHEQVAASDIHTDELKVLFAEIKPAKSGDNLIEDYMNSISDLTEREAPLAVFEPLQTDEKAANRPSPEQLGEPTNISAEFVGKVAEVATKHGVSLEEAEKIVKQQPLRTPPPQAVTGEYFGNTNAGNSDSNDATPPFETPPSQPREPLTPEQTEMNGIAAEELIEWYDAIQAGLSVWAYDYFTSPKKTVEIVETLLPKITRGNATQAERELYERAQTQLLGYTKRKGLFADDAPMSATIKSRSIRLLDKILEIRGITIPPELLLGLLLLTPIVMNLSKIWIEKNGHSGGDELLGKFEQFVTKQESEFWKKDDEPQP